MLAELVALLFNPLLHPLGRQKLRESLLPLLSLTVNIFHRKALGEFIPSAIFSILRLPAVERAPNIRRVANPTLGLLKRSPTDRVLGSLLIWCQADGVLVLLDRLRAQDVRVLRRDLAVGLLLGLVVRALLGSC